MSHSGGIPSFTYNPSIPVERQWQAPSLETTPLSQDALRLFSTFANISDEEEIKRRAKTARDYVLGYSGETPETRPYKCVYQFWFLQPFIQTNPVYAQWKANGELADMKIVDIGCCMGTDIRQMITDGVGEVLGIDYSGQFIRAGFDLFDDKDRMHNRLMQVDFLEGMGEPGKGGQLPEKLKCYEGMFDAACASMVLHVFETKEEVAEFIQRAWKLLKPGGVFFGRNRPEWVHSAESLAEVLRNTGFENVAVELDERVHLLLSSELELSRSAIDADTATPKPTCFRGTKRC